MPGFKNLGGLLFHSKKPPADVGGKKGAQKVDVVVHNRDGYEVGVTQTKTALTVIIDSKPYVFKKQVEKQSKETIRRQNQLTLRQLNPELADIVIRELLSTGRDGGEDIIADINTTTASQTNKPKSSRDQYPRGPSRSSNDSDSVKGYDALFSVAGEKIACFNHKFCMKVVNGNQVIDYNTTLNTHGDKLIGKIKEKLDAGRYDETCSIVSTRGLNSYNKLIDHPKFKDVLSDRKEALKKNLKGATNSLEFTKAMNELDEFKKNEKRLEAPNDTSTSIIELEKEPFITRFPEGLSSNDMLAYYDLEFRLVEKPHFFINEHVLTKDNPMTTQFWDQVAQEGSANPLGPLDSTHLSLDEKDKEKLRKKFLTIIFPKRTYSDDGLGDVRTPEQRSQYANLFLKIGGKLGNAVDEIGSEYFKRCFDEKKTDFIKALVQNPENDTILKTAQIVSDIMEWAEVKEQHPINLHQGSSSTYVYYRLSENEQKVTCGYLEEKAVNIAIRKAIEGDGDFEIAEMMLGDNHTSQGNDILEIVLQPNSLTQSQNGEWTVTLNTLQELKALAEEKGTALPLIVREYIAP